MPPPPSSNLFAQPSLRSRRPRSMSGRPRRGCLLHQFTIQERRKGAVNKQGRMKLPQWEGGMATTASVTVNQAELGETIRVGLLGGLVGGVIIWIYEAIVWVGIQHLMPLAGIPRNATGLVFGKAAQDSLGAVAYLVGTSIHFFFALAWGVAFAWVWPIFARRGYEASLVGMFFAVFLWVVMHIAIALASSNHPNYLDPNVIIGGFMSHLFYAVPLALFVKHRLSANG